jgi:hypothetical protein
MLLDVNIEQPLICAYRVVDRAVVSRAKYRGSKAFRKAIEVLFAKWVDFG